MTGSAGLQPDRYCGRGGSMTLPTGDIPIYRERLAFVFLQLPLSAPLVIPVKTAIRLIK
jgi:hypothetical protein